MVKVVNKALIYYYFNELIRALMPKMLYNMRQVSSKLVYAFRNKRSVTHTVTQTNFFPSGK